MAVGNILLSRPTVVTLEQGVAADIAAAYHAGTGTYHASLGCTAAGNLEGILKELKRNEQSLVRVNSGNQTGIVKDLGWSDLTLQNCTSTMTAAFLSVSLLQIEYVK
eukprot:1971291-Amphidinium_carterae.1